MTTEAEQSSWSNLAKAQDAKYGALGLRHVPVSEMPNAIDALFALLNLRGGERMLDVGPGPQGGMGLVAALTGLDVVLVEYDQPFQINVDQLRKRFQGAGATGAIAQLGNQHGTIEVRPIDGLTRLLEPFHRLIAAAGGTLTIVPGDFSRTDVQTKALAHGPFDHVVCTDVISPMGDGLRDTTAMLTTDDEASSESILRGIARASANARTLYTGFLVPEQSVECSERIARSYRLLERSIRPHATDFRFEPTFSPSSGTVCRSRLYLLDNVAEVAAG